MTLETATAARKRSTGVEDGRASIRAIAILLGILQLLIGGLWSGTPSYWADEAATLSAAGRAFPEMLRLLSGTDAVHGAYYGIQGVWLSLVGTGAFPARLTSVAAVAMTVSGVVLLGARLAGRRAGAYAGVAALFLPGLAWTGLELRSYSFSAMLAVATLLMLEAALRRGGTARWVGYAMALTMSVWVFVFAVLLVLPAAALARSRKAGAAWWWSTGAAAVASLPIVAVTSQQTSQVTWIGNDPRQLMESMFVGQYFFGQRSNGASESWFAHAAVALALLTLAVLCWFIHRAIQDRRSEQVLLVAAWVAAPTLILVGVTLLGKPLYVERYLTFTAPGLCLWVGLALAAMPKRAGLAALTAFCLLATPVLVLQKTQDAKRDNYEAIARFVDFEKEPGAAVIHATIQSKGVGIAYPDQFAGLEDVAQAEGPVESAEFWGRNMPPDVLPVDELAGRQVFVLTQTLYPHDHPLMADPYRLLKADPYAAQLLDAGCRLDGEPFVNTYIVYVLDC
ncbi:mannosyltransferase [Arthrobacter sp. CAN_A214]|uniref:glycosyltransferase family 39 protein n=1 Tax=Arthrobacter sp. CAN_A214 TaxID=2787720 RepID=UPI0018C9B38E